MKKKWAPKHKLPQKIEQYIFTRAEGAELRFGLCSFWFWFFRCRVCHVLGLCYTICTLLNKIAGKTSRCESMYSSFEQLKEFKIDVKKGISESLKKTKHFALRIFS